MSCRRAFPVALAILSGVLLGPPRSARGDEALTVLVVDQDARANSPSNAGAVWNLSLADHPELAPAWELSARYGDLTLEYLSAIAVSPADSRVWLADRRASSTDPGRLRVLECGTRDAEILAEHASLVSPSGLAFLPDGRLALVDHESDPSSLGPDREGGAGPGALFWVDVSTGELSLLSDGTAHAPLPGVADGESVFERPRALTADGDGSRFHVVDPAADPLGVGRPGAVFSVDAATGFVELASAATGFRILRGLAARPDGSLLVVDGIPGDSIVWNVDPASPDPTSNAVVFTEDSRFHLLDAIAVDEEGNVFLTDLGLWDAPLGAFLVAPAVYRVDADDAPSTNVRLVHASGELVTPIALAAEPSCPALARDGELAVGPHVERGSLVADAFDPSCRQPAWRVCPDRFVPGDLTVPIVIRGEADLLGSGVTFYQHSENVLMAVTRRGRDIVLSFL